MRRAHTELSTLDTTHNPPQPPPTHTHTHTHTEPGKGQQNALLKSMQKHPPQPTHKSEPQSNIAIEWFKTNKMIENPAKFQAIVLNKKRSDPTNINPQVDNQVIKSVSSVDPLGIQIDDKLRILIYTLAKFVNLRKIN